MTDQTTTPEVIEREKQIVRELAQLGSADEVRLNDAGWDSRVYSYGDNTYFVKFPRSPKIQGRYRLQIDALRLASSLNAGVRIPKITWEHPDDEYFGYQGVAGEALSVILPRLDEAAKRLVGQKLGGFLRQFHSLSLDGVRDMDVEAEIEQFQRWYGNGLPASLQYFSPDEQRALKSLVFETWPQQFRALRYEPALCHGDFHFANIFYDAGEIGIIDFGDVCSADHSKDFDDFDDQLIFETALAVYGSPDSDLRRKISLREQTADIISLTARLAKADEPAIEESVAAIKRTLSEGRQV